MKYTLLLTLTFLICSFSLFGLPWSEEKQEQIVQHIEKKWRAELSRYPELSYPIEEPEQLYSLYGQEKIPLFSYGSLLNKESAARTLSEEALATHRPAIAFGIKRIFDRHVPTTKRWGPIERPNDTAMLNVHRTKEFSQITNGVIIEVDSKDLKNLITREEGYDLIPVIVTDWNNTEEKTPTLSIAYTFRASEEAREGIYYTHRRINPVPGYALASKAGAAQYGKDFLKLWSTSTFLADKVTPFTAWEKNSEIDCQFEEGCLLPKN